MKKHWIAALAALALIPLAVTAQSPEERIHQAMTRAQEVGIPVSLLESKMAEGHAKGVPLERIAVAIERRLQGLERAREVMRRGAQELDATQISVGADALGAGVSEEVLQEIAASSGGERRAVAVAALTQLVLQGILPQEALQRVQAALARGPAALANLPAQARAGGAFIPGGAGPPAGTPGAAQGGPPGSVPAPGRGTLTSLLPCSSRRRSASCTPRSSWASRPSATDRASRTTSMSGGTPSERRPGPRCGPRAGFSGEYGDRRSGRPTPRTE